MRMLEINSLEKFRSLLGSAEDICIVAHTHPDGDAAGSCLALYHFLERRMCVRPHVILPDSLPSYLDFMIPETGLLIAESNIEAARELISSAGLVVCMDMNSFNRSGCLEEMLRSSAAEKVLIDHHLNPSVSDFSLVFSEVDVSSTCELLYFILVGIIGDEGAAGIPEKARTALMTGMTTDTNNFANSVFPGTFAMASGLLSAGVDRDAILSRLYNEYRENRVRAMGYVLSDLLKIRDDGLAYFVLRRDDWKRLGLEDGETEGFVNIPLGIGKVKLSVFLKEDDGFFRVSIRSKKGISANRLARECFNGGGHECAAGGRLYWPGDISSPDGAEEYVMNVTARFLQNGLPVE